MTLMAIKNQKGATLVVALIILLVMTMVGVSTMRSTTLQERMAANARQYQLAQNAAEHALRTAEEWMTTSVTSSADFAGFTNSTAGLYSAIRMPDTTTTSPLADSVDLSDDSAWPSIGVEVTAGLSADTTSQNPRYIIEYIGRGNLHNSGININLLGEGGSSESPEPYFFRITAIGYGRDTNIYSVLESTYRTGSSDYFTY